MRKTWKINRASLSKLLFVSLGCLSPPPYGSPITSTPTSTPSPPPCQPAAAASTTPTSATCSTPTSATSSTPSAATVSNLSNIFHPLDDFPTGDSYR
ncbi:hypothetical protein ACP275_06G190100 [Erythranthe tilingii]